jgi:pilus assembly protein CpaE
MAEKVTGEQFQKVVDYLRRLYSYIIIDTSSYLTDIVLSAMELADVIILITTQDIPSIKNAKTFLNLADAFRFSRKRIIFTMNRFDKRILISPEKVGESLRQEISMVIPLDEKTAVSAVNRGIPFMIDNKALPIGKTILGLAELVRERITKLESLEVETAAKR